MPAKERDIHPIIRQIIDRDCHVGATDREVVIHVIKKLRNGMDTFRAMKAKDQQSFVEQCLDQHRANQTLYREVMSGFRSTCRGEESIESQARSILDELLSQGDTTDAG